MGRRILLIAVIALTVVTAVVFSGMEMLAVSPRLPLPVSPARLVGRGIAIAERGTGVGTGSSDITVNPDGTVTAITSMPDNGTGGLTVVAQVVADTIGPANAAPASIARSCCVRSWARRMSSCCRYSPASPFL